MQRVRQTGSTAPAKIGGAGIIIPAVASPTSLLELQRVAWLAIATGLHLLAHAVLRFLRSED
jgi:hypothetical protein